jgi:micrococcal nuclease
MRVTLLALAMLSAFGVSAAHSDPCKAIPDRGPMPSYLSPGTRFTGPVVYVGDGDSLCVAVGPSPQQWVEVRLADFYAPELHEPAGEQAKAALGRIASGRRASCIASHRSHDRVVAHCQIDGLYIGDWLRRAGIQEGGNGAR